MEKMHRLEWNPKVWIMQGQKYYSSQSSFTEVRNYRVRAYLD